MVTQKYLHSPKPGYTYVRKGGEYLGRIKSPPGTREFDDEYWAILNGRRAVKTSFAALITQYRTSDIWADLKPRTSSDYDNIFDYIKKTNGEKDAKKFTKKDIVNARDANKHRARFSGYLVSTLSALFEYAQELGWIDHNTAKSVRKLKIAKEKQRPHLPWTDEACRIFREKAHRRARLALELGIGSVRRPGDLVGFLWKHYDGAALDVKQGKTDVKLLLPCTPQLKRALEEEKAARGGSPHPFSPILTGEKGGVLTYSGLAQMVRKERIRLGLGEFDQHGWRYRGVMELAWAGCDDDEIMSYSGHATKEMVRKYAGEARQQMRARSANAKRSRNGTGTEPKR